MAVWRVTADIQPNDAADFMFSTGAWASTPDGVTTTGLDVDPITDTTDPRFVADATRRPASTSGSAASPR